jgi:hypothetical protein
MIGKLYSVMYWDGFAWTPIGKSENRALTRVTYNKYRKANPDKPVAVCEVIEFNKNDDAIFGDDIQEQKELEYDI